MQPSREKGIKSRHLLLVAILLACGCTDAPLLDLGARQSAIVNGTIDQDQAHKAVGILHSGNKAACTATLIGKRTVLTAAHCVVDKATNQKFWPVNFYIGGMSGTKYSATSATAHPNYAGANQADIAVVRLATDVVGVVPMGLASSPPSQGEGVVLVGYGLPAESTGKYGTKRKAPNTIGKVTTTVISFYGASDGNGNVCNGDSGGPSFAMRGGMEVQVGVHSTKGGSCGQEGHDMRVDAYYGWIVGQAQGDLFKGDQSAPTVSITSPAPGAVLGQSFKVNVAATDDVAVTRVALFLDGEKLAERDQAPYGFQLQKIPLGQRTFEAVAFDAGGKSASAVVQVTITDGSATKPGPGTAPGPDTAGPNTPPPGSYGAACTDHFECNSGMCAMDTVVQRRFCTQRCQVTNTSSCPQGNICHPVGDKAVCAPLHGDGDSDDGLSGGCSVGGSGSGSFGVLIVLIGLVFLRRKH
jgi:V8-like Glu-specific endopeptidase